MCPTPNPDIHSEQDHTAYGILAHAIRLARQEAELRGVGWACLCGTVERAGSGSDVVAGGTSVSKRSVRTDGMAKGAAQACSRDVSACDR